MALLNLEKTYHYLLISLGFFLPLTVVGGNLIVGAIVFIWLFSGGYQRKISQIINNRLAIASVLFFSAHVVGLIWTEDILWGLHIVKKMWYFLLLLPILITIVKKEDVRYYISAFLLAMMLSELLSYLVWFEAIPAFKNATLMNPTPFMSHISYNPLLAFTFYLISHEVVFNKKLKDVQRYMYGFFALTITVNMFITGGRAGQVAFFIIASILIFQVYGKNLKALLFSILMILGVFFTAYNNSALFSERFDRIESEISNYDNFKDTSVGLRLTFAIHSWEIIKNNVFIGVGTGDFPNEYKRINMSKTPQLKNAKNPHNMYTLILTQLGLFGLFALLYIFYVQFRMAAASEGKFLKDVGLILPILFLIIMWSDSYLLGHYTTLMFVFFSSFLYKDFEKP
jgi:O-antigen ligase